MRIYTRDDTEHGVEYVRWKDAANELERMEQDLNANRAMVRRLRDELAKALEAVAEKHRERKCSESDLTE